MMRQGASRKRPAPGSIPLDQENINVGENKYDPHALANSAAAQLNSAALQMPQFQGMQQPERTPVNDPSNYATPAEGYDAYPYNETQTKPRSSTGQLVRRPPSNQVVPVNNWESTGLTTNYGGLPQRTEDGWSAQYDDLNRRALQAERETHAKRKTIPPFVQKLSSFLDENTDTRNTDLIRWSEDGDSFIVVDEDEFAKTLIPELFKHNNYASFVRQLNMYGFHKKVGLSDNSMRASERKNKNPSEYTNPYFKRGRPNLLWLIHKPKNAPSKAFAKGGGRAKQEDAQDDVDDTLNGETSATPNQEQQDHGNALNNGRQPLMLSNGPGITLPPDQVQSLQQELAEIRQNQQRINQMLINTRQQNNQLYSQAKAFHDLHQKHDNSINAILTFLATIYNKNLKEGEFANSLPARAQGQGNIVDVGDDKEPSTTNNSYQQPYRKPPLLLKDKESPGIDSANVKMEWPGSNDPFNYSNKGSQALHSPTVQELPDRTPSNRSSQSPQLNAETSSADRQLPEADIMSMINKANANASAYNATNMPGTHMEFPEALSHLQNSNGASPLTPSQRNNMIQLMANEQGSANTGALTSYSPTSNASAANLASFAFTQDNLNEIARRMQEQDEQLSNLQNTVAPLSPSGSIPGLNDQSYNPAPGELDIDSIFNSNDYFNTSDAINPSDFDYPDLDLNFGGDGGGDVNAYSNGNGNGHVDGVDFDTGGEHSGSLNDRDDDRVVETMNSSEATSPATTVVDGGETEPYEGSPRKIRRRN